MNSSCVATLIVLIYLIYKSKYTYYLEKTHFIFHFTWFVTSKLHPRIQTLAKVMPSKVGSPNFNLMTWNMIVPFEHESLGLILETLIIRVLKKLLIYSYKVHQICSAKTVKIFFLLLTILNKKLIIGTMLKCESRHSHECCLNSGLATTECQANQLKWTVN